MYKKGNKNIHPVILQISGTNIERVHFNFLGLTLKNWKEHVDNISNKCSRIIGILNKLKHYLPIHVKLMLYNSLIQPPLHYCIKAWGYKCGERIIQLQKKVVGIISLSKYNTHTDSVSKQLNIFKLKDSLHMQEPKFYCKFIYSKLPVYFNLLSTNPLYTYSYYI